MISVEKKKIIETEKNLSLSEPVTSKRGHVRMIT